MGSLIRARARRILIFVGTRKALEQYDLAGVPILTRLIPEEQREKTIYDFSMSDDGVLVADGSVVGGWRVPHDTFVVFDESWTYASDHPRTIQAKGRAQRVTFDWTSHLITNPERKA